MKSLISTVVLALARRLGLSVYKYPKADNTATVVLLFDHGKTTLVIRRGKEPYAGKLAFPGGFLNIGQETLRQCAHRELKEETTVDLDEDDFHPVDERSDPKRDPRGHVIDHGFVVLAGDEVKQRVLRTMQARSDAKEVRMTAVSTLLSQKMAFDHRELLLAALKAVGIPAN